MTDATTLSLTDSDQIAVKKGATINIVEITMPIPGAPAAWQTTVPEAIYNEWRAAVPALPESPFAVAAQAVVAAE